MNISLRFFAFATALLMLSSPAVLAEPSKKPLSRYWELVAQSDLIGRGRLGVPVTELKKSILSKKYDYIKLTINITETAKGQPPKEPLTVRYFTRPADYSPSASSLEANAGKEVIVFLLHVDRAEEPGLYFASHSVDAVRPDNSADFAAIRSEVKNQQEIAQDFGRLPIGKSTGIDERVRKLFDRLAKKESQKAAWEDLLKLTHKDVPSIVRVMDNDRPLAQAYAYVPNPPNFFEAKAQYGPPRIVEAAAILLNHITGTSFRFVHNGGSESERIAEVNGWRVWSYYNF